MSVDTCEEEHRWKTYRDITEDRMEDFVMKNNRRGSLSSILFSPVRGPENNHQEFLTPERTINETPELEETMMTPLSSTEICQDDDLMASSPENIDCDCISVELLTAPIKHNYDDTEDCLKKENAESFDWSEFIETCHKQVNLGMENEMELVEDLKYDDKEYDEDSQDSVGSVLARIYEDDNNKHIMLGTGSDTG